MKHLILALVLASFSAVSMAAVNEYKLTRIQYTAADGVRYDTARRNLYLTDSQAVLDTSTKQFWLKAEITVGNYVPGDRDVFEKYVYSSAGGNKLNLVNSKGQRSTATILRASPLRLSFDTGVILNFRDVSYSGRDRNPSIRSLETMNNAIEDAVANDAPIGQIGF